MKSVYIIIENGDPYENVYLSFDSAVDKVKEKYQDTIDEQIKEAEGEPICSEIDTPEDLVSGKTYLYVEKGIHIYIYRLPISEK
jgi:hypothetical protein